MGEEADARDHGGDANDEGRILEWEIGLPTDDDLTPLSQSLVPPELASAFSITPEPARTLLDVHRASHNTVSGLRRQNSSSSSAATATAALKSFLPSPADDPMVLEGDESDPAKDDAAAAELSRKFRRPDPPPPPLSAVAEETEDSSALRMDNSTDDTSARSLKRPRLVWTPQLHKRFVDVVAHLGIKSAVPKTIMQLMNVEGLTRENVASHLQKYRLYLKRMQGLSNEGPSSSDHLFASTPVPQSLHEQLPPAPPQPPHVPMPMPYAVPTMIPMPVFSMAHHHGHGGSSVGMVPVNNRQSSPAAYHGFESHHHHHNPYGGFGERPKDWPGGNNYRSIVSYPRVTPNDK